MLKNFLPVLIFTMTASSAFAIERSELNTDFFDRFNDPYLVQYVNEAIDTNHNAKMATIRVEEYRQNVKATFAQELPYLGVSPSFMWNKMPNYDLLNDLNIKRHAFALPFTASYEVDLFSSNKENTKSQKKSYEMGLLDEKTAYISLLTDVASAYTNILQYDKLIIEQEKLLDNYRQILTDDTKKFSRGVITDTDLNNSKLNLEMLNVEMETLVKQRESLLMELATLVGRNVDESSQLPRGNFDAFEYGGTIPTEIESDVIFSRPDVLKAEKYLEKAKLDVSVARKNFLPKFDITGMLIFNTMIPGWGWSTALGSLMAGLTQDLFTGGRTAATHRYQKARYEELLESYTETGLEAAEEVNMSLCYIKHDSLVEDNTKEELSLNTKNQYNAQKMLDRGVISRSQNLTAKNQCISSNMDLAKAKTQRIMDYYTLYKSVGGQL